MLTPLDIENKTFNKQTDEKVLYTYGAMYAQHRDDGGAAG